MSDIIYKKVYSQLPQINEKEVWRYAGYAGFSESDQSSLAQLLSEVEAATASSFSGRVCYRVIDLSWKEEKPLLPFSYTSDKLNICLKDSTKAVIFAATIGHDIDTKIMQAQKLSPTKALIMQALGAERIEALCDFFCQEIKSEYAPLGLYATPRFSPGYGDWDLSVQQEFFKELDIYHQIGISLGEGLLMRPSKSVTAIFGLKNTLTQCVEEKHCDSCDNTQCLYRTS